MLLNHQNLDGVMIGRGVQGRPWFPAQVDALLKGSAYNSPSEHEIIKTLEEHVVALSDFYGEYTGIRVARKHIGWYLSRLAGVDQLRRIFNRLDSLQSQVNFIKALPFSGNLVTK